MTPHLFSVTLSLRSHCDELDERSSLCVASIIRSRDHGESMGEGPLVDSGFLSTSPFSLVMPSLSKYLLRANLLCGLLLFLHRR